MVGCLPLATSSGALTSDDKTMVGIAASVAATPCATMHNRALAAPPLVAAMGRAVRTSRKTEASMLGSKAFGSLVSASASRISHASSDCACSNQRCNAASRGALAVSTPSSLHETSSRRSIHPAGCTTGAIRSITVAGFFQSYVSFAMARSTCDKGFCGLKELSAALMRLMPLWLCSPPSFLTGLISSPIGS